MRPSRVNEVWSPLVSSGMIMKVLYLASRKEEMAGAMTLQYEVTQMEEVNLLITSEHRTKTTTRE